jgi:hypothetical protein
MIEACLAHPQNWFQYDFVKKSLNLSMFFERLDLPVKLLIKIIEKAVTNPKFDQTPSWTDVAKTKDKGVIVNFIEK